jgi:hypothetical protein
LLLRRQLISAGNRVLECAQSLRSGWWSWREIDGRKCWYKKVGAVPPKSEFMWPQDAQQELSSARAIEAMPATSPRIDMARVKPVDPTATDLRVNERRVGLLGGSYLSGLRAIGGTWEVPTLIEPGPDTFAARYGQW